MWDIPCIDNCEFENSISLVKPCTYHRRGHKFESCTAHHAALSISNSYGIYHASLYYCIVCCRSCRSECMVQKARQIIKIRLQAFSLPAQTLLIRLSLSIRSIRSSAFCFSKSTVNARSVGDEG